MTWEPLPTPQQLRAEQQRVRALFSGREPEEFRSGLVPIRDGRPRVPGTPHVELRQELVARGSGLLVPASAAAVAPLDMIQVFTTGEELFGVPMLGTVTLEQLRRMTFADVLQFVANTLAAYRRPGLSAQEADLQFAEQWLTKDALRRAKMLLRDPKRRLVVPQALYVMAKLAAMYCADTVPPGTEPAHPAAALFGAIEVLDRADEAEDDDPIIGTTVGSFSSFVVANQHLNKPLDADQLMARFVRQWLELPAERIAEQRVVNLEAAFFDATGASLRDLVIVAVGLWIAVLNNGEPGVAPTWFDTLGWPADRLEATLRLFCADLATVRAGLQGEVEPGLAWAFSTLERYPVVRLTDQSLLVVEPHLLIRRVFGGLTIYDIVDPLRKRGDKKLASAVEQCVQHLAEVYALEALYSVAGGGPASPRVFDDAALRAAFARPGRRIADAAVDYGDAWVVAEITTSKLKRQSVAASAQALSEDLDKLVGEVEQIDSTIAALRSDEPALTGAQPGPARRFYPLLVVAEGFPVNPATTEHLRQRVLHRGLLTGPDVAPLEVIDTVELSMLEALAEQVGPSMRDVLAGKEKGVFFRTSVRDYLLSECGYRLQRPRRIDELLHKATDLPLDALQQAADDAGQAR